MAKDPTHRLDVSEPREGIKYIYANAITQDWTNTDYRLRFAERNIQPQYRNRGEIVTRLEERVSVTMTWGTLKNLRDMLSSDIKAHEDKFGEIKAGD